MENFFDPQSVALIGASANPKKLGHQLLKNLIKGGFKGAIFPVNLKEKKILKLPVFQSILDIHRKIDLACIIVPREIVPQVLRQCLHKEIPYVLIISAGFAEKDALGKKLQEELVTVTRGTKTRIIGPNCLGLIDTSGKLNLTFAATEVKPGGIGLILQSGAIGAAIFDWAKVNNVGISKFISLGNKVHLTEIDALRVFAQDPNTKVIALYLEEISNPAKFLFTCREVTAKKPIIILKGGATLAGAQAAQSHTAALSTPGKLNVALFEQANLLVAEDFEELLNFLEIFAKKTYDLEKNTLAIITNAGGPGILAADAAAHHKLILPKISASQSNKIAQKIKSFANLNNPFDLGGDASAESYFELLHFVENSPLFSSVIVIVTPQTATEIEKTAQVIKTFKTSEKPIVTSFLGGTKIQKAVKILTKNHLPHYDDPAEGIELLGKIYRYHRQREIPAKNIEIQPVINQTALTDEEIIKNYQLPCVKSYLVTNDAEVMGLVEEIGFPLVYKTAKKITHKGKARKVGLNITDKIALARALQVIGFPGIIQEMIDSFYEVIVGGRRDKVFGPMVIFGQGGIFTEENADISIKLLPLTEADLDEMIEAPRIWQAIKDLKVKILFKDLIIDLAKIILENQDIAEIELNPIKVMPKKIIAVDINVKRKK